MERNEKPGTWKKTAALWIAGLALAFALGGVAVQEASNAHLRTDAEQTSLQYAHMLAASVPDLEALLSAGRPSAGALAQLRRLRNAGEVFRFKMFSRTGQLLLVSDELDRPGFGAGAQLGDHHGKAATEVAASVLAGRNLVLLKDGRGKPGRPELYSETYVPVVKDGKILGIVEVYVDQTARRAQVRGAYAAVGAAVATVILLLAALGAWQWLRHVRAERAAEQRMRYLARHDALSGALNRASFNDLVQQAARRYENGGCAFAVMCLDLDRFKEVNDSLGHAAGDEVLRQVTERLREAVRHGDHVARLGGDEFAVLQLEVRSAEDVTPLATRVVASLAQPYEVAGQLVPCGASLGVAIYGIDASVTDQLMHKADLALYRAKANGRGSFSFYDGTLDAQRQAYRELTKDLRAALAEERLSLHYQPLFAADGVTLNGYEALLRWNHPTRGSISPMQFIPLAEETGLIVPLGAWVLRRACADAAGWPAPLGVSINLSAAQFRDEQLVGAVSEALRASGLDPKRLELEITESLMMTNTDVVVRALQSLARMGVRIAMDDFGTGYSSLAYLWRFPFDKIKIDRAFTADLDSDPKVSLIVRSIITLAHALRIRVNAEGVETPEQMEVLKRHGCDELQGFLLGRPVPASALPHGPPAGAESPAAHGAASPDLPPPLGSAA